MLESIVKALPDLKTLPDKAYATFFASLALTYKDRTKYDSRGFRDYHFKEFETFANLLIRYHRAPTPLSAPFRSILPDSTYSSVQGPLLDFQIPIPLQTTERFEGTWIVAPPGAGKSNLLLNLISHDLKAVEAHKASLLVMDSQGKKELIGQVERLAQRLPLLLIDTHTPMNIFGIGSKRVENQREQEILDNQAIDLILYIFSTILGTSGTFTTKQATFFRYCIQLILAAKGTIVDLMYLMQPKAIKRYEKFIPKLAPPAQVFFRTQFDLPKQYTETKDQVVWRIDSLLNRTAFARMFTTPQSINLYKELSRPQVICVDTDKALLGEEGTEIFSRFIVALLLSAAQQRAEDSFRLPTYVYIDEAADVIRNDAKIATILDQCRKFKIAMHFAHQRISQIKNTDVIDALTATAIKFAAPHQNDYSFFSKILARDHMDVMKYNFLYKAGKRTTLEVSLPLADVPPMAAPTSTHQKAEDTPSSQRLGLTHRPIDKDQMDL